jgi:hypothetical protein
VTAREVAKAALFFAAFPFLLLIKFLVVDVIREAADVFHETWCRP